MRQVDVAAKLGVDEFTVLNWEKGKGEPEARHVPKLAELLGGHIHPYQPLIWKRVRLFRLSLGLTQKEFANLLQVNESTVARWEGARGILPKKLLRMMGEEVVFHQPNSAIKEEQLKGLKAKWEMET